MLRLAANHTPEIISSPHRRLSAITLLALAISWPGASDAQTVRPDLYVTNGVVNAITESSGILYVGGSFSRMGAPTGCAAPVDLATGLPPWSPKIYAGTALGGVVYATVSDGAGGWYLGGDFQYVNGVAVSNLVHVLADHSIAA